jgi:hypothetical protein
MKQFRTIGLLAIASLFAACSENTMSPRASDEPTTFEYGGGSAADLVPGDTLRFSFTIDPSRQTYYDLGSGNSITFPAGSLCDPTKTKYGQGEWDKPCSVAKSPLTVTVMEWLDSKGHPRVDFNPNVRFVPSSDPRQWVKITFSDLEASLDLSFSILYCPSVHSKCKDESKTDPSLVTYRDPITHMLTRRIKHFSGYNVAAGDDGSGDPVDGVSSLSSLMIDSPFRTVAQVAAHQKSLTIVARPVADRPRGGVMLIDARTVRQRAGYILASG